jgi:hypothetical protein
MPPIFIVAQSCGLPPLKVYGYTRFVLAVSRFGSILAKASLIHHEEAESKQIPISRGDVTGRLHDVKDYSLNSIQSLTVVILIQHVNMRGDRKRQGCGWSRC